MKIATQLGLISALKSDFMGFLEEFHCDGVADLFEMKIPYAYIVKKNAKFEFWRIFYLRLWPYPWMKFDEILIRYIV